MFLINCFHSMLTSPVLVELWLKHSSPRLQQPRPDLLELHLVQFHGTPADVTLHRLAPSEARLCPQCRAPDSSQNYQSSLWCLDQFKSSQNGTQYKPILLIDCMSTVRAISCSLQYDYYFYSFSFYRFL